MGLIMDKEFVLLSDNKTLFDKMETHVQGLKHYAFSVLLVNASRGMLLQRRAASKYHSGGLWSNACCGHPLNVETYERVCAAAVKLIYNAFCSPWVFNSCRV